MAATTLISVPSVHKKHTLGAFQQRLQALQHLPPLMPMDLALLGLDDLPQAIGGPCDGSQPWQSPLMATPPTALASGGLFPALHSGGVKVWLRQVTFLRRAVVCVHACLFFASNLHLLL